MWMPEQKSGTFGKAAVQTGIAFTTVHCTPIHQRALDSCRSEPILCSCRHILTSALPAHSKWESTESRQIDKNRQWHQVDTRFQETWSFSHNAQWLTDDITKFLLSMTGMLRWSWGIKRLSYILWVMFRKKKGYLMDFEESLSKHEPFTTMTFRDKF